MGSSSKVNKAAAPLEKKPLLIFDEAFFDEVVQNGSGSLTFRANHGGEVAVYQLNRDHLPVAAFFTMAHGQMVQLAEQAVFHGPEGSALSEPAALQINQCSREGVICPYPAHL
nr:hypothetical protein [Alkalicoccus luteus]